MISMRSFPLYAVASALLCSVVMAQSAAPTVRIVSPIDESQLVTLAGNVNPHANAENDRGPVSASFALPDLTLVLSRSAEEQAAFNAYVAGEYNPGSPNYHQWLTPAEIGERFGPAEADIATVSNWLLSQGFTVKSVSPDRMTIRFAGTAGTVQSAFHTEIHNLSVKGVSHYANMSDPQIPAALAPVVVGIKALHNFLPRPMHRVGSVVKLNRQLGGWQRLSTAVPTSFPSPHPLAAAAPIGSKPLAATGTHTDFGTSYPATSENLAYLEEDVSPYDFGTIYDATSVWSNGITGSGQTIAIAGTSLISASDVASFRSAFDLPAGLTPNQIDTKDGPTATECTSTNPDAVCGIDDLLENSLDVEWSGAVAQGAQIDLVVTGQNSEGSIDTVFDSAKYVVDNLTAKILSVSYGECELGQGTAENVAYYDLWEQAAAEGISVFVATGDSGSPACDDGQDEAYGNPYTAQLGLSVSGIASTPYNTAVGGTDFSWCQPYWNSGGSAIEGCPSAAGTASGDTPYWNSSNASNGASAANYVPEIPWNDTCENPIWAKFLESSATVVGLSAGTTPEQACNFVYNDWEQVYQDTEGSWMLAPFVDTVGGSGGASGCVVNSTNPDSTTGQLGTCNTGATSTGASEGSIALTNDGWQKPYWQTGVSGIPSDGVRDTPDVSFFAGDGSLNSATLICVSALVPCVYSNSTDIQELEVGGTSVATPQMAGVMALINQKAGAAQGLANPELYKLASEENYANCSAETVKNNTAGCYFQDVDNGPSGYSSAQTNSMPCNLNGSPEGGAIYEEGEWQSYGPFGGVASSNCTALHSGDTIGTLTVSGTAAYNGATGYDMATGLGSLNVANVVNAWTSDAGTHAATIGVVLNPSSGSLQASTPLILTVTMTGSGGLGTPTGTIVVAGGGYSGSGTLSGGTVQITVPAGSLAVGSDTLTVTYSGDATYASTSTTETVNVAAAAATVTIAAPASDNVANSVAVTVTVSGSAGVPTGTVTLAQGTNYSSPAATLNSGGAASFTIPANTLAVGSDTLTASYSGNSTYTSGTGAVPIQIVGTTALAPTLTVSISTSTPTSSTIYTSQALTVGITVSGSGATPTGTAWLTAGSYSSLTTTGATALVNGVASITVPAGTFAAGQQTITVFYSGDATFAASNKATSVTLTQSKYSLQAGTVSPASVTPPGTATVAITGVTPTPATNQYYSGTVSFTTCAMTSSSVTNPSSPPTCSISGSIVFTDGEPSGSATATVYTTSYSSGELVRPKLGNGKGWLGGGGMVLALLVFFGIPSRRKSWRAMLGMVVLLGAVLGGMSACGGGGGGGGSTSTPATSPGTYTFTATGQGNDTASTTATTTFTVTVN